MNNTKERILNKVRELFFKRGFSKVTMDELASELGMSKKTLYNHFSSKSEMLELVIKDLKHELSSGVDRILVDDSLNFIEKLSSILSFIASKLSGMEATFISDLKRTSPALSRELDEYKKEAAFGRFNALLDEGIQKGYVRQDIDRSMAVLLYASIIEWVMNPANTQQIPDEVKAQLPYKSTDMFRGMVEVMLNGILTDNS
ncbi:TetR/AcrR family transcriptional regulator [Fodinibius halophilus]|uniref:TetR/AcrR family transcriptional regulator n=1 Tax=Fodinibius halophilus TaxID=1736908 RepID=A0A6M1T1T8_9BACT|nr:TetR/AcrR family transcriptional regulator [Fodinibius halophilus]NGP87165.1 TetR/AcrR family transcriptional regulator [Fodinibius halophilus]